MLIVFSGLPGTGKTTIARALARSLDAQYVRVDTVEQSLLNDGGQCLVASGAGYRVAYAIAEDNLALGSSVIADCVNPIAVTRRAWYDVAMRSRAAVIDVLVVCSDRAEHRSRIEAREFGTRASDWREIMNREFEPVSAEAIVIDTAGRSAQECLEALQSEISKRRGVQRPTCP